MKEPHNAGNQPQPTIACGAGLRREHYQTILQDRPSVAWLELITENFMVEGGRPRYVLDQVCADYTVGLHGVSLSLGSVEPVDRSYLDRLDMLVRLVEPMVVSDHLCWTRLDQYNSHDLLPLPFTEEAVGVVAAKIRHVQDRLGRQLLVENIATYVQFRNSTLTECEFVTAVAEEADCGLLLDVNNLYVNARNHGFDPVEYLMHLPATRVQQFHLAGHDDQEDVILDTHDRPVAGDVWDLFHAAVHYVGPRPTIIERDEHIPDFGDIQKEIAMAQEILDGVVEH